MNASLRTVQSTDNTPITYAVTGQGPGLVVVPGSMCSAIDYSRLAAALADTFTVYIVNRRGHDASGPIAAGHHMATECQDLLAVLRETKARLLFGHSIGGLISLQTTLLEPVDKLAVYEPPLSMHGSISSDWLPAMQQALADKHYAKAMATIMKGLQLSADASSLPTPLLTAVIGMMLRLRKDSDGQSWGKHIISLLPTMPTDIGLVRELDSKAEQFRALQTPVLLLGGDKSASHFKLAVQTLAETLPNAQTMMLPKLEHNAPNQDAPEVVAAQLRSFFGQ